MGKTLLNILTEEKETKIKRVPIASSNIATVGYDKETHILEIEFHHGAIYQYIDLQERVFEELMSSPAKGAYFMNKIKSKFEYK